MNDKEPQINAQAIHMENKQRTSTNSYELRIKYFILSGAPIETDAAYAYRYHEPQMKAPRVTPLEGVYTYCFTIRGRGVENPQGFGIDERRFVILGTVNRCC